MTVAKKQIYTRQDVEDLLLQQQEEIIERDKPTPPAFWVPLACYLAFLFALVLLAKSLGD